MAEENNDAEKTHDPTQKRLEDAHARGDVVKSQEVSSWFLIAGGTLVLSSFGSTIATGLTAPLRELVARSSTLAVDGPALIGLARSLGMVLLSTLGVPLLLLMIAAVAGNIIQHRPVLSAKSMAPKFSKLSPAQGMKRLFGKQAAANFAKGLLKLVTLGAVMVAVLWPERARLDAMLSIAPEALLGVTSALTMKVLGTVVALLAAVAIGDYFFQYRSWFTRQKMTLEEIKEELKQSDGDPVIKGKLRQLRMARLKRRMMAAVPKASVIITNPTHYAVALSYERGMAAPVCVAKGVDLIALKIREIAEEHRVPIVENVPLARALYATVKIDAEIPVEHYHAVAQIIGYVMGLKRSAGERRA